MCNNKIMQVPLIQETDGEILYKLSQIWKKYLILKKL